MLLYAKYKTSRDQIDSYLLALLNNQTVLTFDTFTAAFVMETSWKAAHLSKQTFLFPQYYCRGQNTKSDYFVPIGNFHVFMIDKFLLCPQITLNSTEYHIDSRSNKLVIEPDRKPVSYLDYTVSLNNEVRVCLREYHAVMTSHCYLLVAPLCITTLGVLSFLLL